MQENHFTLGADGRAPQSLEDTMRKRSIFLAALPALIMAGCDDDPTSPDNNDPLEFTAEMTGAAERPTPVETDATGTASFTVTKGSATGYDPDASGPTTVTYTGSVTGLSGGATQAHIHGPAGTAATADPIVTLTVSSTGTSGNILAGSFTTTGDPEISMDSLVVLMQNGNAYVNIHTAANPAGEIRGQIEED